MEAPLVGSGRDADVYALDDDRVLRRYRKDATVEREARVMRHLHGLGYPVPAATTYALMAAFDVPGLPDQVRAGLLAALRAGCGADPADGLAGAVAVRRDDTNLTSGEHARLGALRLS